MRKHISVQEARDMVEALKRKEIALGRAEDTWYLYGNHVFGVADAAKAIALKIKEMDADRVYVAALLHDIAKMEERTGRFHGILGYEMLKDRDEDAARACLLHMFPWNKVLPFEKCSKMFFENKKDYDFVVDYAKNTAVRDEDLLIQLADSLASKDGIVTFEERKREYVERNKIEVTPELLKDLFEPRLELKEYFDKKINGDIYDLFKEI